MGVGPAPCGAAVRLKMRLQFAGWLQYLVPTPVILLLGLLGGLLLLLDVGGLRLSSSCRRGSSRWSPFDIVTTKWKIRFPSGDRPSSMRSRPSTCCVPGTRADVPDPRHVDDDRQALLDAWTPNAAFHDRRHHTRLEQHRGTTDRLADGERVGVPRRHRSQGLRSDRRHRRGPNPAASRHGREPHGARHLLDRPGADHDSVIAHLGDRSTRPPNRSSACAPWATGHGMCRCSSGCSTTRCPPDAVPSASSSSPTTR